MPTGGFSRIENNLITNTRGYKTFPAVIPWTNLDDILKINTRGNTRGRVHVIPVRPVSTGAETRGSRVSYSKLQLMQVQIEIFEKKKN